MSSSSSSRLLGSSVAKHTTLERVVEPRAALLLFVPPDEAVRFGEGISIGNQVAMARVDKAGFESGELSKGSEFAVWDRYTQSKLVVSEVVRGGDDGGLMVSINGVNVTEWDIYNDGHVIVHRTDDFFTLGMQLIHIINKLAIFLGSMPRASK